MEKKKTIELYEVSKCPTCGALIYSDNKWDGDTPPKPVYTCECRIYARSPWCILYVPSYPEKKPWDINYYPSITTADPANGSIWIEDNNELPEVVNIPSVWIN